MEKERIEKELKSERDDKARMEARLVVLDERKRACEVREQNLEGQLVAKQREVEAMDHQRKQAYNNGRNSMRSEAEAIKKDMSAESKKQMDDFKRDQLNRLSAVNGRLLADLAKAHQDAAALRASALKSDAEKTTLRQALTAREAENLKLRADMRGALQHFSSMLSPESSATKSA